VGRDRPADLLHVTVVGTATAAKNVDVSKGRTKIPVLSPEFIGITIIELYRFIEFRVAQARRIGAKTSDARGPLFAGCQRALEMGRVGTVDHVVSGTVIRGGVHLLDGFAIGISQRFGGIAESFSPVGARSPGSTLQQETNTVLLGDFDVRQKIVAQTLATITVFQQVEGGEIG
jgi:hypothetical protein